MGTRFRVIFDAKGWRVQYKNRGVFWGDVYFLSGRTGTFTSKKEAEEVKKSLKKGVIPDGL